MKKFLFSAALAASTVVFAGTAAAEGFYASVQGGYTGARNHSFDGTADRVRTNLKGGYNLGAALGYDYGAVFGPNMGARAELEYSYARNKVKRHNNESQSDSRGRASSNTYMVNGLLDIHNDSPVTPYVGGGMGLARVKYSGYGVGGTAQLNDSSTRFAYQFIGGVAIDVTPQIALTGDYRYMATTSPRVRNVDGDRSRTSYKTHNFLVGARYSF